MALNLNCYIPCFLSDRVSVVNATSLTVVATIPVGHNPTWCAITPDATTVFCVNRTAVTVSVIDTATNLVTGTIILPGGTVSPFVAACNNNFLYVGATAAVIIYSLPSLAFVGIITPPDVRDLHISNDGKWVYTCDQLQNISGIDTSTNTLTVTITDPSGVPATGNARYLNITPNSLRVYVSDQHFNTVYSCAIGSSAPPTIIPVTDTPEILGPSMDGQFIYVPSVTTGDIAVIQTSTDLVVHTDVTGNVPIQTAQEGGQPSPGSYVTDAAGFIYFYNAAGTLVSTVPTATGLVYSAVSPDGKRLFAVDGVAGVGTCYVFDTTTMLQIAAVPVASEPQMVVTANAQVGPTLTVPKLFVPRKGMLFSYSPQDLAADWRAIERWANSWAPVLFFPRKDDYEMPTLADIQANWLTLEVWAQAVAGSVLGSASITFRRLEIPIRDAMTPQALTTDFLYLENWASTL